MKVKLLVISLSLIMAASAWAGSAIAADQPTATDVTPQASETAPVPDQLQQMNANLDKMHDLIGQMQTVTDQGERQKLMFEFMAAQRDNMTLMRDFMMANGGMLGGGMMNRDGMRGPGMGMMGGFGRGERDHCEYSKRSRHHWDDEDCNCPMQMRGGGWMGSQHQRVMERLDEIEQRLDQLEGAGVQKQ